LKIKKIGQFLSKELRKMSKITDIEHENVEKVIQFCYLHTYAKIFTKMSQFLQKF